MSEKEFLKQIKANHAEKCDANLSNVAYSKGNAEALVARFFYDGFQPTFLWVAPLISSKSVIMRKINSLDSSKLQALLEGSEESIKSMLRDGFKWVYVCTNPDASGKLLSSKLAKWTPCRIEHFLEVLKQNQLTIQSSKEEGLSLKRVKTRKVTLVAWTHHNIEYFSEVLKQNQFTIQSSEEEGLFLQHIEAHHAHDVIPIVDSSPKLLMTL